MSIATSIVAAQQKVANAYTAVSNKGGTLPATQDLSNLPTAIGSISTGGSITSLSITPTTSQQTITASGGVDGYSPITVSAVTSSIDANIQAGNIKDGVSILGVTGSYSGGGGTTVDVKACGTETYTTDDKVILTPTDNLFDTTLYSYTYGPIAKTANNTNMYRYANGGVLDYTKAAVNFGNYDYTAGIITLLWNADKTATTGSFTTGAPGTQGYSVEYKTGNNYAYFYKTDMNYPRAQVSIGYYRNGVFSSVFSQVQPQYASTQDVALFGQYAAYNGTVYDIENAASYTVPSAGGAFQFPVKYNGTWYIACCGRYSAQQGVFAFNDLTTKVYDLGGWGYYTEGGVLMQPVDDDVDYIFASPGSTWGLYKINKNNSSWTTTLLSEVSAALENSFNRDSAASNTFRDTVTFNCKDFGTYVEMFVIGPLWGYNQSGGGNKVAHFKFYKATDTIERLPDVFPEVSGYEYATTLTVNWQLGLISVGLFNRDNVSDTKTYSYALYTKKFDELAGAYPYFAYPNSKDYYYQDSITGFVKSNKGVDELGNTVLEVECTEDPNHSWSPTGRVLGMSITVNEGEP